MSKPREFALGIARGQGEYDHIYEIPEDLDGPRPHHVHVIEKSAYDELKVALKRILDESADNTISAIAWDALNPESEWTTS